MKKLAMTLLCFAPVIALAQNPTGMNQQDMQKMMQQMQKAASCMEKIDKSEMEVLKQKQKKFEAEMRSLCSSGKRDAAQAKAMDYAKEISNSTMMKSMRECGKMMQGMMQDMHFVDQEEYKNKHVCDSEFSEM